MFCGVNVYDMQGLYINLDHRTDRDQHMRQLISEHKWLSGLQRFSAIKHVNGAIGCALSHIGVLQRLQVMAELNGLGYVGVFEDDLSILNKAYFLKFQTAFERIKDLPDWDVIVLTPRGDTMREATSEPLRMAGFLRICNNQTTTAYLIKTAVLNNFIKAYKDAVLGLLKHGDPNVYALDQYWKRLQQNHRFYYYQEVYAGQLVGWSDIEQRPVNYNQRFLQQTQY